MTNLQLNILVKGDQDLPVLDFLLKKVGVSQLSCNHIAVFIIWIVRQRWVTIRQDWGRCCGSCGSCILAHCLPIELKSQNLWSLFKIQVESNTSLAFLWIDDINPSLFYGVEVQNVSIRVQSVLSIPDLSNKSVKIEIILVIALI